MKIQLRNTRVENLSFVTNDEVAKDEFSLGVANGYSDKEPNVFLVRFDVKVKSEHGYELKMDYEAEFATDEDISQEFKESHFPVVNAPAIAYPYMRSFVSLLTLNGGYEVLILPTVNFQEMAKRQKGKQ
ncbi:MAG: protein-export chaperone SecB [Alteromonadaceae bacterium]|nr:protein-export chaperone SecB [Alteromonadaceae bacterium]